MRNFTRIRGGYRANNMSGARRGGLSRITGNPILKRAIKTLGPTVGNLAYQGYKSAKARGMTGKIDPFIRLLLNNPQLLSALKDSGATLLNNGLGLVGMGVIQSPRTIGNATITHPGTGITLSRYSTSASRLPRWVTTNGQRYIYSFLGTSSCFKIANDDYPALNAVGMFPTFGKTALDSMRSYMFAGTGTANTESGWLSQQGGGVSGKFYIANCRSEVMITSATNLNCTLRIYELVSKESTDVVALRSPLTAWSDGITDALGINDSNTYRTIGIFPGHSEAFREYYHVDKMIDVKLPAGASHKHVSNYVINTRVPFSTFLNSDVNAVFAGLTRHYMFVLTPSPIHDASLEANVSLGRVSVDIVIKQTYEYYGITGQHPVINVVNLTDEVTTPEAVIDTDFAETGNIY